MLSFRLSSGSTLRHWLGDPSLDLCLDVNNLFKGVCMVRLAKKQRGSQPLELSIQWKGEQLDNRAVQ